LETLTMTKFISPTILIAGLALSLGSAAPAFAGSPADMQRCQQLYETWTKYSETAANTRAAVNGVAFDQCRKGNTEAGIKTLTRLFEQAGMTLPPVQSADQR
jgi:hypothetical protein